MQTFFHFLFCNFLIWYQTDVVNGESMGVISDKRIKDLEEELMVMKSSWIEPSQHEQLQQKLIEVTEAKETFEVDFLINVFVSFMQK